MIVKANVSMMAITMAVLMTMTMMVINTGRTSDDTGDSWTRPVILILCNLCKDTVNLVAIGNKIGTTSTKSTLDFFTSRRIR